MADLIQFVDSIAASPTVRLDLNDEVTFWVRSFSAPPPRLRRSVASNAMRDGAHVGSSSYDARTLTLEVELRESTQDLGAVDLQALWRELDRESNWLMYQPNGLTKPVFFRTFRSDASALEDVRAQAAMRTITIELLAEPFALGLKESLGPFTVSNDPAAGSNGCYFDVTSVKGDVAAPVVLWHDAPGGRTWLSVTPMATPQFTWTQAEAGTAITLGTDTTNPGGGPAAGYSGTGTNNYVATTFATDLTMVERVRWSVPAATTPGTYRVFALVSLPGSTTGRLVQLWSPDTSDVVTGGLMVARSEPIDPAAGAGVVGLPHHAIVDFGLVEIGGDGPSTAGHSSSTFARAATDLSFRASSSAGDDLYWDAFMLVPAWDESSTLISAMLPTGALGVVYDGITERAFCQSVAGDPTAGSGTIAPAISPTVTGAFPSVAPGSTCRFFLMRATDHRSTWNKALSTTVSGAYWPRYLFVRPVAS